MKKFVLEIIVFVIGAAVMIFELTGARIIAPYVGTSLPTWAALIGVVLGSLSIGYAWGGKIADKNPSSERLSLILLGAAATIAAAALISQLVLNSFWLIFNDFRLVAVLSCVVLFGPASVFMGMVSPFAARLKIASAETSGTTVGRLYAISTLGSIFGTFFAGFFLIMVLGSTAILYALAAVVFVLGILSHGRKLETAVLAAVFIFGSAFYDSTQQVGMEKIIADIETPYARVRVYDAPDGKTGKQARFLQINNELASAIFLEDDELVFEYTKFYDSLAEFFKPNFSKALMIGGGTYVYPKHFVNKYENASIDVVEIDPRLLEIAKTYFRFEDNPRLKIYHEDGRIFLNQTAEKYDIIFGDTFKSLYSIPFHLTSREAARRMFEILEDDGAVLINIISTIEGNGSKFLRAEYRTFKEVFPYVYLFPTKAPNSNEIQNIILAALKLPPPTAVGDVWRWQKAVPLDMPILTDDFAPVEQYNILLLTATYR